MNYIDIFMEELSNIDSYVEYIENNYYVQSAKLSKKTNISEIGNLTKQFEEDGVKNQTLIKKIYEEIVKYIDIYEDEVKDKVGKFGEKKVLNDIRLKIFKDESLKNYINMTIFDCYDEYPQLYSKTYEEQIEIFKDIKPEILKNEVCTLAKGEIEKLEKLSSQDNERYIDEYKVWLNYSIQDYQDVIDYYSNETKNYVIEDTEEILIDLKTLKTLYQVFDDDNKINIYRQAFILVMTAFDAFINEFAKDILVNKFDEFISEIGKDKPKITYDDVIVYSTIIEFKKAMVEKHVESIKLTSLVKIVSKICSYIFVGDNLNSDIYKTILEMISRRNVHIHRCGICDNQYFINAEGNPFNLKKDDYIAIDKYYYQGCVNVFKTIINNIKQ